MSNNVLENLGRAHRGLSIIYEIYQSGRRLSESERQVFALRELIRRLASGNNCLEYLNRTTCQTRSDFIVRGIYPQVDNVFNIRMNTASVSEDLNINFGLYDQGLSFGNVALSGRSAQSIGSENAGHVYAWLIGVQLKVFENRGRPLNGSLPRL